MEDEPEFTEALEAIPLGRSTVKLRSCKMLSEAAKRLADVLKKEDDAVDWSCSYMIQDTEDPGLLSKAPGEEAEEVEYGKAVSARANLIRIKVKLNTHGRRITFGLTVNPEDDDKFANGVGIQLSPNGLLDVAGVPLPQSDYDPLGDEIAMSITAGQLSLHRNKKLVAELGPAPAASMHAVVFVYEPRVVVRVMETRTCPDVTTLDLNGNRIGDAGAAFIGGALERASSKITYLDLGLNMIGDAGVARLAEALAKESCFVSTLSLCHNGVGDLGAKHLADALRKDTCCITSLDLTDNRIGDKGAEKLSKALQHKSCQVTSIKLALNKIGSDGLVLLAEALEQDTCSVTEITLAFNQFTKQAKKRLADTFASTLRLDVV